MRPFRELVVVELDGSIAGAYAGRLFAGFGATVVLVPARSPARTGPLRTYLDAGKQERLIEPGDERGLASLLAAADVVIESSSPEPLQPRSRQIALPGLVKCYVSPFGLAGPYAGLRSNAFTDYAAGGHMCLTGEPERHPIKGAGSQPEYAAGLHAFTGIMAALRAREVTGRGQEIDIAHMDTMVSLHQWTSVRYTHSGTVQRRVGNRYDTLHPVTVYPSKDGHVAISASSEDQSERLMAIAGIGEHHEDPRFATGAARLVNWEAFDALLLPWLLERTTAEIVEICQEVRVPVAPVPSLLELLEDPQLVARGFFHEVEDDRGHRLKVPGPPFRFSNHRWMAPASGTPANQPRGANERMPAPSLEDGPLQGVRILDLTRVWAGPLCLRMLGDLGADVIRVEATWSRPKSYSDLFVNVTGRFPNNEAGERPWNREGMYNKFNRNKRAITLDLDRPEAKATFEALVKTADIVVDNYSPRVMPNFGLDYERLRKLNPSIITMSMPGYGWSGPCRDWVAYGTTLEPHAGLASMIGYEGSGPYKSGVAWADPVAAMHGAAALMIALHDREADPERRGQSIELAQFEGMIGLIGEHLVEAQLTRKNPERTGNRTPHAAPQGVYRCAGDDRWIAVSVTSDAEWAALAKAIHAGPLAHLDLEARQVAHDDLDIAIEAWTSTRSPVEAMRILQGEGVIAVPLFDARDLVENEHLRARGAWVPITHPDCGTIDFPALPIHLSETPATYRRPAPGYGEHNREVLRELLGTPGEEIERLFQIGILRDEP